MTRITTLSQELQPLMEGTSISLNHCAICGRSWPLNNHHIVRRSQGVFYRAGVKIPKPTITLCGSGNTSGCHGLAHQNRLHFRWVKSAQPADTYGMKTISAGHWEYVLCECSTKYRDALKRTGWKRIYVSGDELWT